MDDVDLDYGAITIDTCIFDSYGIALDKGLLNKLSQFSTSPVQFLITDIVHYELRSHLSKKIKDARHKIEQAIRASHKQKLSDKSGSEQAKLLLFGEGDDGQVADKRLNAFYAITRAKILESERHVDIGRLIQMYFQEAPPFEGSSGKKCEFPDAIALTGLEAWAKASDVKVLAVSNDKGWKQYSDNSLHIDVIDSLGDALSHFQPHTSVKGITSELLETVSSGGTNQILDAIGAALENSIDGIDIDVDASSSYYFETDDVHATYLDHRYHQLPSGDLEINLIQIDAGSIVFDIPLVVECEVECTFYLSIYDSIDKEYIQISDVTLTSEAEYLTAALVTLSGDFSMGVSKLDVEEVEILDSSIHVDFGEVGVDFGYEE